MNILALVLVVLASTGFFWKRGLRFLHYYQQEEYDSPRFRRWLIAARAFDRRGSLIAILAFGLWLTQVPPLLVAVLGALALGIVSLREANPLQAAKKKLVMTLRAKRIWWLAFLLFAAGQALLAVVVHIYLPAGSIWLLEVVAFQAFPLVLMLANALLKPGEARIQQRFLNEAQDIIQRISPRIIGITGSYGKTSSKKLLSYLLNQSLGPTFSTPGSINTVMGITREIREHLSPGTKFAVIEMAAYHRGSIARLCELTPPQAALVTNIGIMHLERFGSPENVLLAKSELPQAVPADGILVCNGDNPGCLTIAQRHRKRVTLLFGIHADPASLDCRASAIEITRDGMQFTIHWQGQAYPAFSPQLGEAALLNILGAFTMACALGAKPEYLVALLKTIAPERNRLQLARDSQGSWLHDAYSSNPAGFNSALDVLQAMPARKRILITPGMVELGSQQAAENRRIAARAAGICDLVLLVGETNRSAWVEGMESAGAKPERYHWCATRDLAFAYLRDVRAEGDIVLVENDLPDLYEGRPTF